MSAPPLHLRIFLASPGDVPDERRIAFEVINRLPEQTLLVGKVTLEIVAWDDPKAPVPMEVGGAPQESVDRYKVDPGDCDLMIAIFWTRLGSPGRRADGRRYESGTVEEMKAARLGRGKVWVYHRTEEPCWREHEVRDDKRRTELLGQRKTLEIFLEGLASSYNKYENPATFADLLKKHLEAFVRNRLEGLSAGRVAPAAPSRDPEVEIDSLGSTEGSEVFGRERDFEFLDKVWDEGRLRVVALVAGGGVGKSTLVRQWLNRLRERGWAGTERVFALSFYDQGTSNRMASADLFVNDALKWFGDSEPRVGSAWHLGERLAELVASKRTILVLDGLEPMQSSVGFDVGKIHDPGLAALVSGVARAGSSLCIITTRESIADLDEFEDKVVQRNLDQLSREAGRTLLRQKRIQGSDSALEAAASAFGNHALALSLLASYLREIRRSADWAETIPNLDIAEGEGRHPRRVMAAFETHLSVAEPALVQLLRVLGLFDRPVERRWLSAVMQAPVFPGLNDHLVALTDTDCDRIVARLRDLKLLFPARRVSKALDAHPLVRLHFGEQLRRRHRQAWSEGHKRIFDHLREATEDLPKTLEEMAPFYQAVAHGCQAGLARDAYQVFSGRINRQDGPPYFAFGVLNAIGQNLASLWWFFDPSHEQLDQSLEPRQQAEILSHVGHCLRALGALTASLHFLERSAALHEANQSTGRAAVVSGNLARTLTMLGRVAEATRWAQHALELAAQPKGPGKSDYQWWRVGVQANCALGGVLHCTGDRNADAEELFKKAAEAQRQAHAFNSEAPAFLDRVQGFQYCEFLIDQGRYDQALELASAGLARAQSEGVAIDIGRARVAVAKAMSALGRPPEAIQDLLDRAVTDLRQAQTRHELHVGLLARAEFFARMAHQRSADRDRYLSMAEENLDEARELANRTGMRGVLVDCYIQYADVEQARNAVSKAEEYLRKAEMLTEATGFGRRNGDLQRLKKHGQPSVVTDPPAASMSRLQRELERLGVTPAASLSGRHFGSLTVGEIIVDADLRDYSGVRPDQVVVNMVDSVAFPPSVLDAKAKIVRPVPNNGKVHLIDWSPPIIDQGDRLTLTLAISDFWHSEAIGDSLEELQREIVAGKLQLARFPRRLDVQVVLLTRDNRLVLSYRGGNVRYDRETWCATIGESMDPDKDRDRYFVDPYRTAIRGLCERDELNLADLVGGDGRSVDVEFVAICTEWQYLQVNLVTIARLQHPYQDVLDRFSKGEHSTLDSVEFDLDRCLELVVCGRHAMDKGDLKAPLNPISRLSVLATLLHQFKRPAVIAALERWSSSGRTDG